MMADKIPDEELAGIDLSSWRMAINCSEPVRYESHERFLRRFQSYGLRPSAIASCYAMAETTFAVTQTSSGVEPRTLSLDRTELSRGRLKRASNDDTARICVSSGKPIDGCDVRVVDEGRNELGRGTSAKSRSPRCRCSTVIETILKKQRKCCKRAGITLATTDFNLNATSS